jgi:hypothetical protein
MRDAYSLFACLFLCFASFQAPASDKSTVQVPYVGDGTNLYTYNIDSRTLQPTLTPQMQPLRLGEQSHCLRFRTGSQPRGNRRIRKDIQQP